MSDQLLFEIALAPSAALIWARFFVWPLATVMLIWLVCVRVQPHRKGLTAALLVRKGMLAVALTLAASLALAYFLIPKSDPQVFVFWYGSVLGAIPVFLPAVIAWCLNLHSRDEPAMTDCAVLDHEHPLRPATSDPKGRGNT